MSTGIAGIATGGATNGAATGILAGDAQGAVGANTVVAIRGNPVATGALGPGDAGKAYVWDGTKFVAAAVAADPSGTLAVAVAANRMVIPTSAGLVPHDGSEASAELLLFGGMQTTGGSMGASITYSPSGKVFVGVTGWDVDVPLYDNGAGGMVPAGDPTLTGIFSCKCGTYDGVYFHVAKGGTVEGF